MKTQYKALLIFSGVLGFVITVLAAGHATPTAGDTVTQLRSSFVPGEQKAAVVKQQSLILKNNANNNQQSVISAKNPAVSRIDSTGYSVEGTQPSAVAPSDTITVGGLDIYSKDFWNRYIGKTLTCVYDNPVVDGYGGARDGRGYLKYDGTNWSFRFQGSQRYTYNTGYMNLGGTPSKNYGTYSVSLTADGKMTGHWYTFWYDNAFFFGGWKSVTAYASCQY